MKTPFDFGATGDGVADDTDAVTSLLSCGDRAVRFPDGAKFSIVKALIPQGMVVELYSEIHARNPTSGPALTVPLIEVSSGVRVMAGYRGALFGDGTVGRSGLAGSGTSDVVIDGLTVKNFNGVGIANYTSGNKWRVTNCDVRNVTSHGIDIQRTSDVLIAFNSVDHALHGIMWYGGDAAVSAKRTVENIRIIGNTVSNVMGAIWGTLGAHITAVGNHVIYCTDVGIDFEGCSLFTATGNTAAECKNGCYAVFYGSERGVITGNTGLNYSYPATCYYNHGGTSTNMVVNTNAFNR